MASTSSSSSYSCIINQIEPFFPLPSYYHATCNQIVAPVYCKPFLFPSSATNNKQLRLDVATSVAFNPSGNYEMSLFDDEDDTPRVSPPGPPKAERVEVVINNDVVKRLDIFHFRKQLAFIICHHRQWIRNNFLNVQLVSQSTSKEKVNMTPENCHNILKYDCGLCFWMQLIHGYLSCLTGEEESSHVTQPC